MKTLQVFTAIALMSGCTVVRIDRQPLAQVPPEPAGEIRFMALRGEHPDRLAEGYSLTVMKNLAIVGTCDSSSTEPTIVDGLSPGRYAISISGRAINTRNAEVRVRPGQATIVRLMVRNARQLAAFGEAALTAGKLVFYAVGYAIYAVVWVCLHISDGDDDDDEDDDGQVSPGKAQKRSKPDSVSPYRKK